LSRFLTLGQVVGAHGVRGGIKVTSYTDPPEALLNHRNWYLGREAGTGELQKLRSGDSHHGQLRVLLEGVADRDQAARLTGCWVQIERSELAPTAEREHFREDLVGMPVSNLEGVKLGTVSHFVDLPAGAVMVVRGEREHWVPASPPQLRRVDTAARSILVDWPDEL